MPEVINDSPPNSYWIYNASQKRSTWLPIFRVCFLGMLLTPTIAGWLHWETDREMDIGMQEVYLEVFWDQQLCGIMETGWSRGEVEL